MSSFKAMAMDRVAKLATPGLRPEQLVQEYNNWSKESYNMQLNDKLYKGPMITANAVAHYVRDGRDVTILDVGAGTGLIAAKLKELGFHHLHALDPSDGMLEVARAKNLYKRYLNVFFTSDVNSIGTSAYDVLVCCGAMIEGHIKCDSLAEMVRCVKTGGLVVIVMREEYLWTVSKYRNRLEPYMTQLQTEGQWVLLERTVFPNFLGHYNGVLFVFRVSKEASK